MSVVKKKKKKRTKKTLGLEVNTNSNKDHTVI